MRILFAFFFLSFVTPVFAQQTSLLPPADPDLTPQQFESLTKIVKSIPFGRKELEYEMRIQEDWIVKDMGSDTSQKISLNLLGDIGRMFGPPVLGKRSFIVIQASVLQHEILAFEWLEHYIQSNGYTPVSSKKLEDFQAEALYIRLYGQEPFILLSRAIIHGKTMVLVSYAVPVDMYAQMAPMQKASINSFKFSYELDEKIEDQRRFSLMKAATIKYPASWEIKHANLRSIDRLSAEAHNINLSGRVDGVIRVEAVYRYEDTSLKGEMLRIRDVLAEQKISLSKLKKSSKLSLKSPRFIMANQEVYAISIDSKEVDQEFWFTVLGDGQSFFFLTLLTPTRNAALYEWARNVRAYELIVESIE